MLLLVALGFASGYGGASPRILPSEAPISLRSSSVASLPHHSFARAKAELLQLILRESCSKAAASTRLRRGFAQQTAAITAPKQLISTNWRNIKGKRLVKKRNQRKEYTFNGILIKIIENEGKYRARSFSKGIEPMF